jgi:conjugative relaxase-like TrwC/TraI family protein
MLTAMILRGNTDDLAAYHCRNENYYFKQAGSAEKEFYNVAGEFPKRDAELSYVTVHGQLSESLGYKNGQAITEDNLLSLMNGQNKAGEKITQKHKVKGIDLTFSAPKSVSITGLVLDKNPEIIKAHDEAVLEVMAEIEKSFAVARPNPNQRWNTGKMVYATVKDGYSREHDPHLHTHCILMNITQWQDKFMGIWTKKIIQKDFNKMFGAIYRSKLAAKLTENGYNIKYIKNGEWRLDKVSREMEWEFSKRREQILREKNKGALDMDAWHKTRKEKAPGINKEDITKDWQERISKYKINEAENKIKAEEERQEWSKEAQFNIEAEQERTGLRGKNDDDLMWKNAIRRATERTALTSEADLIHEYIKETMRTEKWDPSTYRLALRSLENQFARGKIIRTKGEIHRYTSLELIAAELAYMDFAGVDTKADYSIGAKAAEKYVNELNQNNKAQGGRVMSKIQSQAVVDLLSTKNMISVVQGDAGAGKTSSLKAVADYYKQKDGIEILGLAVQGVTAKKLADEAQIKAITLKSYLGRQRDDRKSGRVIIFDEASMLDSRSAAKLFRNAEENGDRIILVGDENQLESISAGRVFACFVDYYQRMSRMTENVKVIKMNENYRQRDEVLRIAVDAAKKGNMKHSLEILAESGHITEIADKNHRRGQIANLYTKDTLIIAGTKAAKQEINEEIRKRLKAQGKLTDETRYQMVKSDEDGIEHPKNIKLAKGDIISFTRNDYEKYDIRNGEKAEVLENSERNIKVMTEDKRILDINTNEYKNIEYGYALTTYKSQGQTYNKVIIESDTAVPVLSDMRNQYVNITRARDSVKIFTDDTEELKELAEIKTHARDTIEMEREIPTVQKEKTTEKREDTKGQQFYM